MGVVVNIIIVVGICACLYNGCGYIMGVVINIILVGVSI